MNIRRHFSWSIEKAGMGTQKLQESLFLFIKTLKKQTKEQKNCKRVSPFNIVD